MAKTHESAKTKAPASTTRKRGVAAGGARSTGKARERTNGGFTKAKKGSKSPLVPGVNVDMVKARVDFVRYFIEQDFENATGAYQRAYSGASTETAAVNASKLLKDAKIQAALSDELAAVLKEKRRPLEKRILDTWLVRAFYDPTEILDLRGNLKITEAQLRKRGLQVCIDSINKKLNAKGDSYLEYKLADRDKALDMLRQYIQMIEPPKAHVVVENITIGLPPKPPEAESALPPPPELAATAGEAPGA